MENSFYFFKFFLRTNIGLLKFNGEDNQNEYIKKYNSLKNSYSNDSFLNNFLKEISIISYDCTEKIKKENNKIHIIINMNNKYIYPSIVSINSALRNSNKNKTTIVYHILCPMDFRRGNIKKLKSFLNEYPANLEMIFYNMGNLFSDFKRNRFSEVTFYRLLTPIFIPLERVIYLDTDILVFDDLEEMFNLPLNNNYALGFLDLLSNGVDYLGLKSEKYINAGVLLLNLELIRKDKKYVEMLYMLKNNKNLRNNDQTIINYVFYPNIGILPPKFGIFNFDSIFDIKYLYLKNIRQKVDLTELIESIKHPKIMHFVLCNPKVWKPNSYFISKYSRAGILKRINCKKYHDIWIKDIKTTSFSREIIKFYKIKI